MGKKRLGAVALLLPLLVGCSVVTNYPDTVQKAQAAFEDGKSAAAVAQMEKLSPPSGDAALYQMETGTFQRAGADYAASEKSFRQALDLCKEFDERATVSLRDTASYAASLLVNDKAIPYRGAFYERVLLNTFLSMNYLMVGNMENARVMVMQAEQRQKEARAEYDEEIAKSKEEAGKRNLNSDEMAAKVRGGFGDQSAILEKAGNIYQNAFMLYLSSIVFELNGEADNAYILAKLVHELNPGFLSVRADLLRQAKRVGRTEDYDRLRSTFGKDVPDAIPAGHGQIVVLFACGLAPVKEELKSTLSVSLAAGQSPTDVALAIPKYKSRPNPVQAAGVVVDGKVIGATQPLMDVEATAVKDLWDRSAGIAFRQVVRAGVKAAAAEVAKAKGGSFAGQLTTMTGNALEQADLRSWISLPHDMQAFRAATPAGEYPARLDLVDGEGKVVGAIDLGKITVKEGAITFVDARSTGTCGVAGNAVVPSR
jgi:hypothetical protein